MELNREKVKTALEWCIQSESCEYCEYNSGNVDVCPIKSDALALIKELTVELEAMRTAANSYKMHNEKLTEENANLHASCTELTRVQEENERLRVDLDKATADTVRKMHEEIKERCIKGGIYPSLVASTIDQIAKELIDSEG